MQGNWFDWPSPGTQGGRKGMLWLCKYYYPVAAGSQSLSGLVLWKGGGEGGSKGGRKGEDEREEKESEKRRKWK